MTSILTNPVIEYTTKTNFSSLT